MVSIKNKRVLVVGLGVSGYAAGELLAREGARVSVTEAGDGSEVRRRADILAEHSVRVETGGHTSDFCRDAEIVVTSPGVDGASLPLSCAMRGGIPVIGELELGFMFCPAPVIAITGTNGKSTTTELIGRMLSLSGRHTVICGNIGNPLSGEVDRLTEDSIAVVEVSSFQLETIRTFKPRVAVLLNISEDHYERHGDLKNYRAEKFKIFSNQTVHDFAVIHSDLSGTREIAEIKSRTIFFGKGESSSAGVTDGNIIVSVRGRRDVILKVEEVPLKGLHNVDNYVCSALVAGIMGVPVECIREGILTFQGLSHRFERVGVFDGTEFIDDSKATNIDATRRALESVHKKTVLVAGGRDKGGDYLSILPLVREKVKTLVLIGEARAKIKAAFEPDVWTVTAGTMEEAVKIAVKESDKDEIVMLSPMCSSFDMFSSYKERGETFQREVKKLFKHRLMSF